MEKGTGLGKLRDIGKSFIAPVAAVLAMSGCTQASVSDRIQNRTMRCLDGEVPGVDAKVCDPEQATELVRIALAQCFQNEDLDVAKQAVTRALNAQCRDVAIKHTERRVHVEEVEGWLDPENEINKR